MPGLPLRTERVVLRQWKAADREPFARLNADPVAMEFFPARLSRSESDAFAAHNEDAIERDGFGLWAVEIPGEAEFIGFVGIAAVSDVLPFAPATEVGWRLAREYWGRGLAYEAARAVVSFGFEELALPEVVALTAVENLRSRRLMERLGMTRDPADDFLHPTVPAGDPLQAHVLYRLRAPMLGACAGATPTPPAPKN
jgi:RimJ/RimL family protein N-acetyltransferase